MTRSFSVNLTDRINGANVEGEIRTSQPRDFIAWANWRYRNSDGDGSWDWWGIYQECIGSAERFECYSMTAVGELHGLMVVDVHPRQTSAGKAITVDYLATNPANRQPSRGLKHVGIAMVAVAVTRSIEMGVEGCLWLEALSGAAGFYENLGFKKQVEISAEGNAVYVLDKSAANCLLAEIKTQGIVNL